MTKHTRGPWRTDNEGTTSDVFTNGDIIIRQYPEGIRDEKHANANLIAAAPELLEALEYLWGKLSTDEVQRLENISSGLFKNIETLLNKARGGSHD